MRVVSPLAVRAPGRSESSWPLRVSLTDSMIWRNGLKQALAGAGCAVLVGGVDQRHAVVVQASFQLGRGVALVGRQALAVTVGEQGRFGLEQIAGDVTLVGFGGGDRERDRQP